MKDHELLDLLGDVNEDYVLAAGENAARPRFRWRTLAACAACAVLVLGAYPVYRAANPKLHDYTVVEGGSLTTYEENSETAKAPAAGGSTTDADVEASMKADGSTGSYDVGVAPIYSEQGEEDLSRDGPNYTAPGQDIPVQEAALWYDALLSAYRLEENPEWYGGAWIAEDRLLAVAIVDGFRTPKLESEIQEAAGAGAVLQFSTVKYSMEFLQGLMEPAVQALDGTDLSAGMGVDVMANCLGVDLYSDGTAIPDSVLAALAHLDPDGDAIRVRLFTGRLSAYDEAVMKGPAPEPIAAPEAKAQRDQPAAEPSAAPGGVTQPAVGELPEAEESSMPAYKENGLPGYDILYEAER